VGLVVLYTEPNDTPYNCWLGWFCLDEEIRGMGYGKEVLSFAMQKAKESGYKTMSLYCYDDEEFIPALTLYEKFGFSKYKRKEQEIYLKKSL